MSGLSVQGLSVAFDGTRVVDDVSLTVGAGEWVALLGPNGAGKSTLLRAVTGAVAAEGRVTVDGDDPRRLPHRELARRVAMVPQQPVVPPGMRVADYVLLGRTPYIPHLGVETRRDLEIVNDVLERLDLGHLTGRHLDQLSGGERQRAVLARALAQQAPVLLLDEPTSALDVGHQQQVLELVAELRVEHELTILAAMHDLTLAGQFADRLVLLACGLEVAEGAAHEVLTEPVIRHYYGASVRVLDHPDGGVVVVPTRTDTASGEPLDATGVGDRATSTEVVDELPHSDRRP